MGMFAWLRRRRRFASGVREASSPDDGSLHEPGPHTRFGMHPGAVVAGLDFYRAIDFQRRWKLRLGAYVRGEARARQSWREIARDDQCELGRWLRDAPVATPAHAQLVLRLREHHAALHRAAGEIVRMADCGQREAALQALRDGDFAHASHATVARLSELFLALNDARGDEARH